MEGIVKGVCQAIKETAFVMHGIVKRSTTKTRDEAPAIVLPIKDFHITFQSEILLYFVDLICNRAKESWHNCKEDLISILHTMMTSFDKRGSLNQAYPFSDPRSKCF